MSAGTGDAIRKLADSGTPGPWRFTDSETVDDVWEAGLVVVSKDGDPIASVNDEWYEPDPGEPAVVDDARLIVAAVNALRPLADLIDALDQHKPTAMGYCQGCGGEVRLMNCTALPTARDALVAALGVTE